MKAVIMAGGEGTRLRPLTSMLPKPMVPIMNQPVMEHIVGLVKHHGITEIVATLAFMPQVIQDYFGAGEEWGVQIDYAIEETPLGTAGSVKNAQKLLPADEPFIVISGDALTDIDLAKVVAFHKEKGAAVTIALKSVPDPLDFGVVITDDEGKVERFLEKPTWGQVFSDRINTGIYVVEPWVLDEIPADTPYDFSGELFPRLMEKGHPIYGTVVEGYWCDVGSRESYLDVHRDLLDGLGMVFIPGVHAREGLWVADSASIHETAVLGDKVVIGQNVSIHAGACVDDYSIIGDNCVIGSDARVTHSVLWDDTWIGKNSTVSGAVLCRRVDVRSRCVIDDGVSIGLESVIGAGAHVGANVQIFPYKRVEPAAIVNNSIIWESTGVRSLFSEVGIRGLVGIDITVDMALNVAQAFGSLLPKGGQVIVTRDTSRAARMVKRAMIAGLNAAGMNVRDMRMASPAVSRFTTQKTRCVGGIHVAVAPDEPAGLEIRFFDQNGLDIPPWEQKKIERLYFRGEFRRAFLAEVGEIQYPTRPLEYYAQGLNAVVNDANLGDSWQKVVVDMRCGAASVTLPIVVAGWHLNLISLNPVIDSESSVSCGEGIEESLSILRRSVDLFGADAGVVFDSGAERIQVMTPNGVVLDRDTLLHAMMELWCRARTDIEGDVAVPLTASLAVERIVEAHGRSVIRPGRSRRALANSILEGKAVFAGGLSGGFIFGDFFPAFDGVLTVGMMMRMLARLELTLDDLITELPEFHKREATVFCPSDRKGAVMRAVSEASSHLDVNLIEGVRVYYDDGWALVLPDSTEPLVTLWAEAGSAGDAEARVDEWRQVVERAITGE